MVERALTSTKTPIGLHADDFTSEGNMTQKDFFNARSTFETGSGQATLYRLSALGNIDRLPFSIKIMLESVLRNRDGYVVTEKNLKTLSNYNAKAPAAVEIP